MKINLEAQERGSPEPPGDAATSRDVPRPDLTPRQLEILSLIAKGRTNKEIASALGISERTVKFHVAALFKRLCTFSRTEALVVALKLRVIHIEDYL
jgi:two-component system NarL family response regulator